MIEGSLGVKLATAWIAEKQRGEEAEKKVRRESQRRRGKKDERRQSLRKSEKRRCRCAKGRTVAKHCFHPNEFGSGTFECIASIENHMT